MIIGWQRLFHGFRKWEIKNRLSILITPNNYSTAWVSSSLSGASPVRLGWDDLNETQFAPPGLRVWRLHHPHALVDASPSGTTGGQPSLSQPTSDGKLLWNGGTNVFPIIPTELVNKKTSCWKSGPTKIGTT